MANRKQRRKKKENYNDEYSQSTKSILTVVGVVLIVFGLFYLITVLINNSKRGLNTVIPEKTEVSIQYLEILGDDTFTMSPTTYYVLFYDFDGPNAVYYNYIFSQYAGVKENHIYKVDLGSGFNTKFLSDKTNKKAQKAGELKVKDATLIKINKGKNISYTEGSMTVIVDALD